MQATATSYKLSSMAENLIGSEIIKLAGEINAKIKNGEKIYNLTIGDFNPNIFPIPTELKQYITDAYQANETNYPPADGILELRDAVVKYLAKYQGLNFSTDEILIAGGARPLIYAIFQAIVDAGDTVLFPVPSWNNNHYSHLSHAKPVFIETTAQDNFMPTAVGLKPYITDATLLALCSPLNPTGTTFSEKALREICELVITENIRRGIANEKPLYIMYDQIYWVLTYDGIKHIDPVSLYPELKDYTVYVDGLSKSFAATGIRVGWSMGPKYIIDKMKAILGHIGAWAPKAEQVASAKYMTQFDAIDKNLASFKNQVYKRLDGIYQGLKQLQSEGLPVEVVKPQAAIYLTVNFNFIGYSDAKGNVLQTNKDITQYILEEAKVAIVPFYAFGASNDSTWYRISVGTCKLEDIDGIIKNLHTALHKLTKN